MRISDGSSDVCSSDLIGRLVGVMPCSPAGDAPTMERHIHDHADSAGIPVRRTKRRFDESRAAAVAQVRLTRSRARMACPQLAGCRSAALGRFAALAAIRVRMGLVSYV